MILARPSAPAPTTRRGAVLLLGRWATATAVTAAGLVITLASLRPPPMTSDPEVWNRWATGREPSDVVAAMAGPVALVLVVLVTVVAAAAALVVTVSARRGRTVQVPRRAPDFVATFVTAVALLAGSGAAGASTGSGAQAGPAVVDRPVVALVDGRATSTTSATSSTSSTPETTTSTAPTTSTPAPARTTPTTLVSPPDTPPSTTGPPPSAPPVVVAPPQGPAPQAAGPATVEVRRGDSLWRIAERQVATRPELGPTVRYWLRLIDANRSRFVEPGNPNLILPGQVLELPGT